MLDNTTGKILSQYERRIKKTIYLRDNYVDERIAEDTFKGLYHVPPVKINPKTVLDLGANIGLTVAHYEYMWPEADILGVELDTNNVLMAHKNTRKRILNSGVSFKEGYGIYNSSELSWAYRLVSRGDRAVQIHKMGYYIDLLGGFADFVKMDIEGMEYNIIRRDDSWKNKVKYLLVEVHGDDEDDRDEKVDVLTRRLIRDGFSVQLHDIHWSALWAVNDAT